MIFIIHISEQKHVINACFFPLELRLRPRAALAFAKCRRRADVIDPGPSEFIRRSSPDCAASLFMPLRPASLLLSRSFSLPCSHPVCLPLSSSMHYSFIILLQQPYRPHFGEDKTCHLWVLSGGDDGRLQGEEEEEEEEA